MGTAGFKHITVTPAEEEDVVIRAGLPEVSGDNLAEPGVQIEREDAPGQESAPIAEAPAVEAHTAEVPIAEAPTEAPTAEAQVRRMREKKADDYHETTLEDLKPEPMPMAQRIVIIAAVICIIGALAYYFAFMR